MVERTRNTVESYLMDQDRFAENMALFTERAVLTEEQYQERVVDYLNEEPTEEQKVNLVDPSFKIYENKIKNRN